MKINTPISVGELVDKLTILEIKLQQIQNPKKLENIKKEYRELKKIYASITPSMELIALKADLYEVNRSLWMIEDNIREKDRLKQFDAEFIRLAKDVYRARDKRFSHKNEINILFNSEIREEKSYESYS